MLLDDIQSCDDAFLHMERYVNRGSPSGFTGQYTTSPETRSTSLAKSFHLCSVELPESVVAIDKGLRPAFFKWQMLVHPDMIHDDLFRCCIHVDREAVVVSPTSSSRTVKMLEGEGWFLKLCYKGLIGRFDRQLASAHATSAVEVSQAISNAIDSGCLPRTFRFLREAFSRVVFLPVADSHYEWGIVLREPHPHPVNQSKEILVPGFSLTSPDLLKTCDPTLLSQLISRQSKSVEDFLFEDVIAPVYDAYFRLLLCCGLQLEAHAQNIFFTLNEKSHVTGIVARDAESIDKDFSLIADLGIVNTFSDLDYKRLVRGQYNYSIMHSFMFDFKLGEYLITPIINEAICHANIDRIKLTDRIRTYNREYIKQLPADFFPSDNMWYSYDKKIHGRSGQRPYKAKPNPRYR